MGKSVSGGKKNEDLGPDLGAILRQVSGGGGGATGADRDHPDQRWIDALRVNALKVQRVQVNWRVGSAPYRPIETPDGPLIFDVEPYSETNESDPRNEEGGDLKWASRVAFDLWSKAWDWAASEQTKYIDAQLVGQEWSDQKGRFVDVKGCKVAAQIDLSSGTATSADIALGGDPQLALVAMLIGMLERKEERDIRRDQSIDKVIAAASRVAEEGFKAADKAAARTQALSDAQLQDNRENREMILKIMQTKEIGKAWNETLRTVGPALDDLLRSWATPGSGSSIPALAKNLLSSITKDQIEAGKETGISEEIEDIKKLLTAITQTEEHDKHVSLVAKITKIILAHQAQFSAILNSKQRDLAQQMIRAAGLAD